MLCKWLIQPVINTIIISISLWGKDECLIRSGQISNIQLNVPPRCTAWSQLLLFKVTIKISAKYFSYSYKYFSVAVNLWSHACRFHYIFNAYATVKNRAGGVLHLGLSSCEFVRCLSLCVLKTLWTPYLKNQWSEFRPILVTDVM